MTHPSTALKQKNKKKDVIFLSTAKKIIITLILGLIVSGAAAWTANNVYLSLLKNRVSVFALSLNPDQVRSLADPNIKDAVAPIEPVKQKLSALKNIYSEIGFVYIMAEKQGVITFLADSEPTSSASYSPRGEVYPDATLTLKEFFTNKTAFTEGPVSDEFGTWYSAIAPIVDDSGALIAAVGIDVPLSDYLATIAGVAAVPLVITLLGCIAVVSFDMSRRRRFETYRLQGELMSIASHELRSPLSGIRWGQEILLADKPTESQKKMLTIMHESTLRLQESIEDILQLANETPGKMKASRTETLNLSDLIQECMSIQQLSAQKNNLTFVLDSSWQNEQIIAGDATRLRRVFNNLISNAIKYGTPHTGIVFSYRKQSGKHLIGIRNKGIGVPKDELDHIFDGFYRATNAAKTNENGTGMGLYMSRTIIEQHGGKIWLESIQNENTTAYVELPYAKN